MTHLKKVLFVVSGNAPAPFVEAQGDSLIAQGVQISYFRVVGRGIRGYLRSTRELRKQVRKESCDVIHAHYSFCGWVSVLAMTGLPVVISFMGDDALGTPNSRGVLTRKSRLLVLLGKALQPFVRAIITKSPNLQATVYRKSVSHLIPNGVRMEQFSFEPNGFRKELGLDENKRYVLFLGSPEDPNKNSRLAREAVELIGRDDVEFLAPYPVPHDDVAKYLNSVDVVTLCSFSEGSPNVVKEAMACNRCIVTTDVGDTATVIEGTAGCHVASYETADFADKIQQALTFAEQERFTNGRQAIINKGLDAASIAQRLIKVYTRVGGFANRDGRDRGPKDSSSSSVLERTA